MDAETAHSLIRPLADGIDPITGEALVLEGPCQHPQVVRALVAAIRALEHEQARDRRRQRLPPKAGSPWAEEEDERLIAAHEGGKRLGELAREHERTSAAIQARLVKLGKFPLPPPPTVGR